MDIRIVPRPLRGVVTPPPSKSMAHRLLIAAALADGVSAVKNVAFSQDIEATLRCVDALGGHWEAEGDTVRVTGFGGREWSGGGLPVLDCGESGSTLRFFLPIALAVAGGGAFTGRGRLMERPLTPYFTLFDEKGISHKLKDGVLTVRGRLETGDYHLPGNVSSQFFTGLLFAFACQPGEFSLASTTDLESASYVTMTIRALQQAGITVMTDSAGRRYGVFGQRLHRFTASVEADWSQAAFWYAANFLGSAAEVRGLDAFSSQGDKVIAALSRRLREEGEEEVDVSGCPDLLPPLAVMAAGRRGVTRFVNAGRLRLKESDRLTTVRAMLQALGAAAEEGPDSLTVTGGSLRGGTVDGSNDHRIVMAAAAAATACAAPVTILGAEAVDKSYPDFFTRYQELGGEIHVL